MTTDQNAMHLRLPRIAPYFTRSAKSQTHGATLPSRRDTRLRLIADSGRKLKEKALVDDPEPLRLVA
jgi:hypothetical protein